MYAFEAVDAVALPFVQPHAPSTFFAPEQQQLVTAPAVAFGDMVRRIEYNATVWNSTAQHAISRAHTHRWCPSTAASGGLRALSEPLADAVASRPRHYWCWLA